MALVAIPAFDIVYGVQEAAVCNKALWRIGAEPIKDTVEDTKQSRVCRSVYAQTRDELLRTYPFNFATKTVYVPRDEDFILPMNQYSFAFRAENHIPFAATAAGAVLTVAVNAIEDYDSIIGRAVYGTGAVAATNYVQEGSRIIATNEAARTITLDRPVIGVVTAFTMYIPSLKTLEVAANPETIFEIVGGGASRRILCNMVSVVLNDEDCLEVKYVEQVINPDDFDSMFLDALVLRIASKIAVTLSNSANLANMLQSEFAAIMTLAKNATAEEKQIDSPDSWWTDRMGTDPTAQARR